MWIERFAPPKQSPLHSKNIHIKEDTGGECAIPKLAGDMTKVSCAINSILQGSGWITFSVLSSGDLEDQDWRVELRIYVVENLIEILIPRGRPSNKILFIFHIFNWVLKLQLSFHHHTISIIFAKR